MKNTDSHGQTRTDTDLIPKHGGYRGTKTFSLADLIDAITFRFCNKYVNRRSRTHDQMVQAARSGRQNIAEGSVDSATSKKIELKLTGIAKGSLNELRLDYEAFLRDRDLPQWKPDHPSLQRFKALRCATLDEFRGWVANEMKRATGGDNTDSHRQTRTDTRGPTKSVSVRARPCESVSPQVLAANGVLSLLNLCIYLIDRQMKAQAKAFEKDGGFTERLYRQRTQRRREQGH